MKTALITTTINVPTVLALYRKLGPDVAFFVAADEKTPLEAYEFCASIPNCEIYSPDRQSDLGYACSELLGWNCVERRNIALLEAVKSGAEIIVTVDDDNSPMEQGYFGDFYNPFGDFANRHEVARSLVLANGWDGLKASSTTGWFDPGVLLVPQTKHRGFPILIKSDPVFEPVVDAKIGVAQGLCLGDPDIDAVTRIATAPIIHSVSELGRAGIVVDPNCWTVYNTQNTAFIRELAPAMFQMPGVGRYSDIYASLITQRVMRERGLHVHFGQPYVFQQRNKHDLIRDLRQEIDGMANVWKLAGILDGMARFAVDKPIERQIYEKLYGVNWWPKLASDAALAFLEDMEKVL